MKRPPKKGFLVCVSTGDYPASLIARRIYTRLSDPAAESRGLWRVVDESEEDYLYPQKLFTPIDVPDAVARKLRRAA